MLPAGRLLARGQRLRNEGGERGLNLAASVRSVFLADSSPNFCHLKQAGLPQVLLSPPRSDFVRRLLSLAPLSFKAMLLVFFSLTVHDALIKM